MPVDYIVLRCFSCQLFQSHQQRADKKFRCVVCGERQSHRHVYAISNRAADLRKVVQDLNMKHGKLQEERHYMFYLFIFNFPSSGNHFTLIQFMHFSISENISHMRPLMSPLVQILMMIRISQILMMTLNFIMHRPVPLVSVGGHSLPLKTMNQLQPKPPMNPPPCWSPF
jgi:hypothetical protein